MSFGPLITQYSRMYPSISSMGHMRDEDEAHLIDQLRLMQRIESLRAAFVGTPATWDRDIARGLGTDYLEEHKQDIRSYADRYGFDATSVERKLSADGFKRLPYVRAVMTWMQGYLARHKGTKHVRTPEANDLRDAFHCVNAAYVDILVTERFAADVSKPLTTAFGTRVFRSLADLVPALPPEAAA